MFRTLPPLAQLRAFTALAETGSMSAAGDMLNVSHAAISQQVRALEDHLQLTLITRSGRGVALTDDGVRLGQVLRDSFGAMAREVEAMTGVDADRPLQISTTPMFAAGWLMPRLSSFRAMHPDVELMLNPTAQVVKLEPGGVDLTVRFGKGDWPGLEAELLLRTDFIIAAARSLVGDRQITQPADLLDFPWLQEMGTTEVNDWLSSQGVTERKMKSLTHMPGNLILDGVRAGQGVVALTRAFVEADLARGDLVVLFEGAARGFGYFAVTRPGPQRPVVKAFARWLKQEAAAAGNAM